MKKPNPRSKQKRKPKQEQKIIALFQGRPVPAEIIPFEPIKEEWNEYKLKDGTVIRFKSIMARILRLEERNPEGDPIYQLSSQNVAAATVPSRLRKRKH